MSDRIERLKSTMQAVQAAVRIPYKHRSAEHTEMLRFWRRAFTEYNQKHDQKLSMGCYPCYRKVIQWLEEKEPK